MRKNAPIFYKYSNKYSKELRTVCAVRYAPHFFIIMLGHVKLIYR